MVNNSWAEATKRVSKVSWISFLALLRGESLPFEDAEPGPLIVVLDLVPQLQRYSQHLTAE